ncbi:MAG: outer membrane beta-barrel protein [Bacteroidetes bacterium]|nr:outer membrane beta-barrel protein [Bacteroidota bacterium]MCC6656248.1 outer membrane beta-barrel protein [Flavobacteriales bacterium]HMU14449.1 outer membrane beta-barrel family protein [Flavobacteriales bacterium]
MRYTFLLLLMLVLASPAEVRAQRHTMGGERPRVRVFGRVVDGATRKGVEFATINVLAAGKDSIVGGALADEHGDFSMGDMPVGAYRLRIASLGYSNLEQQIQVRPGSDEQDLGNLTLAPAATELKAAEVTAERAQTQLQVDRRVYNVDKDLSVRGGNGLDVMKNVPGLSVDADDNVQLRNGTPQILLDGRPTQLTLDQIPADDIERVEVITNPGVAFDASSGAGIINVVLKRSTRPGYNGQVQLNAGTNRRYGGNASINVKDGRWSWNANLNGGTSENRTNSPTSRDTYAEGAVVQSFHQDGTAWNRRSRYGGRAGGEVQLTNRSTLGLNVNLRGRAMENKDDLIWTESDGAGTLLLGGGQLNSGNNSGYYLGSQATFKHRTPVEGREWTTDLTWNRSHSTNGSDFGTTTNGSDGTPIPGGARTRITTGVSDADRLTWQFDMADPRSERTRSNYGLRSNVNVQRSLLDVVSGSDTSVAAPDPSLSNDYRITDIVNAAYFNWTRKLGTHWGMQAGVRFEQTWFEADVRDPSGTRHQKYTYNYPASWSGIGRALFPAIYLSRKWEGSSREFQVNVSRKIERPNFFQVMPIIMSSDTRNVRIGNPALAPEFITLAEVNHLLPFRKDKRSNWLTSVFARYTDNVITGWAYPMPTDSNVLVNSWINGRDSWTWGWENAVKLDLFKSTQLTLSGTMQYVEIAAGPPFNGRKSGWMGSAKANLSIRLPKDWSIQINGEYEGKRPQPQGYRIPNGGMDVSLSKDLGNHWNVQATMEDVFYTRLWGTIIETPYLYQESYRRHSMRNARVSVSWKFGEQDASLFRRRGEGPRRDPGSESTPGEL